MDRADCIREEHEMETVITCIEHPCPHQWQPIETAKPYINLLLLTEDGVVEGYYHEHNEFRDGGWYATLPSWNDHWQCFPSAWMPPPPLPEGGE